MEHMILRMFFIILWCTISSRCRYHMFWYTLYFETDQRLFINSQFHSDLRAIARKNEASNLEQI